MISHWKRAVLVLLPVAALTVGTAAGSASADPKGEEPEESAGRNSDPTEPGDAADSEIALDEQIAAYQRVYPGLSDEQARSAAEGQDERKAVYEELSGNRGRDFGGAWFEPTTGVLHVAVTNRAAARRAEAASLDQAIQVETHLVRRPVAELERRADAVRKGDDDLAEAARGQVGYDVRSNSVIVAVPADQRASLEERGVPDGITLVDDINVVTEEDYGCTSRTACDWTIRAGSVLWRGWAGNNVCSVGFTGRDAYNQRYTLTAGHCSNGNGVTWGTGTAAIGPMYASVDSGAYDAAIIQVTNPWFASDTGGEIYQTMSVNYVAPTLSYIWAGETVCLSANYTNPTGGNHCGVIGTNSDWWVRGMARVDGLDACGGDSGGGWYWLGSATYRVAYGLHSRSDEGCHGSNGGSHSWFSPLPTIKAGWAPWLNVETR